MEGRRVEGLWLPVKQTELKPNGASATSSKASVAGRPTVRWKTVLKKTAVGWVTYCNTRGTGV